MFIQQLYTNCLSEAAYFVESDGEAVIIDPLRDIDSYLELSRERGASIKYIFETHFHADFVSGHLDLSKKTGAPIIFGPEANTKYNIRQAADGEVFRFGKITLEVMHTPGHTLESTTYLLRDEAGKPHCVFTGDTLFIGDVGRPDLSSGDLSSEELAGILFNTLQEKILPLPDDVIVYPAHGPGSACGKNLGPGTFSTIGQQRKENYALQIKDKDAFVKAVTEGLGAAPKYFAINARINKEGYPELDTVKANGEKPLSLEAFKNWIAADAIILDTRKATEFSNGFIPGSISIGLEGRFAEWAGGLLPYDKPIILVTEQGKESESVVRLTRVGFENLAGHLQGGYQSWVDAGESVDMIIDIEADELLMDIPHDDKLVVLDVRRQAEFANGHLRDALNIPLNEMDDLAAIADLEEENNYYIHCAGGYRSVIAASLLKRQGMHNIRNILGGWESIRQQKNVKIIQEANVLN